MSETSAEAVSGFVDEAEGKIRSNNNTIEPVVKAMQEHPIWTALGALGIGFLLGKML